MESLINMEMSKEEAKQETEPTSQDAPRYPWGLEISLNNESIGKLGLATLPTVDAEVTIIAKATVSRVSEYQTQGGTPDRSLGLQITDMKLDVGSDMLTRAQSLYDSK